MGPPEIKLPLVDFHLGKVYGQVVDTDQKLVDILTPEQRSELAEMRRVMLAHPHEIERERPEHQDTLPA